SASCEDGQRVAAQGHFAGPAADRSDCGEAQSQGKLSRMKSPNFYAGLQLDRAAEKRRHAGWVAGQLARPESRILPVWRAQSLVIEQPEPHAVFLSAAEVNGFDGTTIYLGAFGSTPIFAVDLSALDESSVAAQFSDRGKFVDLRTV